MKATGVILAGGKSSRMGRDKSLLVYENDTLINRMLDEMRPVFAELLIAGSRQDKYNIAGVREIPDIYRDTGPLGGIHAALTAASYQHVFITACDLPFFQGRLAGLLVELSRGYDAVVPRVGNLPEPLFAVYSKNCLPYIESCLSEKNFKITRFYPQVLVHYVDEDVIRSVCDPRTAFYNINTEADYRKARQVISTDRTGK